MPLARFLRAHLLGTVAAALAATGAGFLTVGVAAQEPAPPVPASASRAETTGSTAAKLKAEAAALPVIAPLPASRPVEVRIPKLGVVSAPEDLGLDAAGALQTPQPANVGWYTGGPTPGARGPAVLAGHVTWNKKPAVFFKLGELQRGDRIEVAREDGTTAAFEVERIAQYAKDKFPTVEVYRDLDYAGLRLITCGGTYDEANNRYLDNVVVFARLV